MKIPSQVVEFRISMLRIVLLAFVVALMSCGASSRSTRSNASDPLGEFEDSGKRIAGDFIASVEDAYRGSGSDPQRQAMISFDGDGHFKRQLDSRIDEGSYLITTTGEMIVYIEKVNGEPLTAAKAERYRLDEQSEASMTLTGPARSFLLKRK
ncbi:MAG TPA: hypothetical protein VFB82_22375 [Blastocatellia bacterium]|nr:hypothetical protein [Blastocatellia bacterium]